MGNRECCDEEQGHHSNKMRIQIILISLSFQTFSCQESNKVEEDLSDVSSHGENDELKGDLDITQDREELNDVKVLPEAKSDASEVEVNSLRKEPSNSIWSYVLWRPQVLDDSGLTQSGEAYYHSIRNIKEILNKWFQGDENFERQTIKTKNDMGDLHIPSSSALKANKEPSLYDNFANDFNQLKEKVNDVVSRPEVKDNMFYILMGLTGFLLLFILNDNLFDKSKSRRQKDHYRLSNTGSSAKLPTYDECMMADRNILMNINESDLHHHKINFIVPLPMPKIGQKGQDTEQEDNERNNQ